MHNIKELGAISCLELFYLIFKILDLEFDLKIRF
jgi:hypothetical protein